VKLVDTSVAIDHLRGRQEATQLLVRLSEVDDLAASELVRFELIAGVRSSEVDALESFFDSLAWVPVTEDVAREAGALARRYRRSHANIDDTDYLIGATARILGADLLTRNVKHFPMLRGIKPPY
jgi:predicted nucleic acid-binding protein